MRVDVCAASSAEGDERDARLFGELDGKRCRRGDGKHDLNAAHCSFLDHLVGCSGADDQSAFLPLLPRPQSEKLVERHVASNVLCASRKRSIRQHLSGGVGTASEAAEHLNLLEVAERPVIVLEVEGLGKG